MDLAAPPSLPRIVRHLTEPFPLWVCETGLTGVEPTDLPPADASLWREPGTGAVYENDCERGKRATRDVTRLPPEVARLLAWLRSDAMTGLWAERTGIAGLADDPTLHGGGLHVLAGGGWLNTHLDYARHPTLSDLERRLNLVLFLNPEWREEWGGAFEACAPSGSPVQRVYPAPGRLVAFETTDLSYHGVAGTRPDAPERATLAVSYLAPARPSATRERALFLPSRRPR